MRIGILGTGVVVCNADSLGERIQRASPGTRVVKTLNTMNSNAMVDPRLVPGDSDVFVSGNDAAAKARVTEIPNITFHIARP